MQTVIEFQRISRRFGRQVALADVSFEVPPGTVFALLGENGAGKTTAIRIMLGLTAVDRGSVRVLGGDPQAEGQRVRRQVGYVAERPTLYEWMTVEEIGWFSAGFYPAGYLASYRQLLREFGLPADRKLKQLSKGMRAKVALALALAHDPQLLVLDEPTSGLDPVVRRQFLESMVDRAAAGKTVFLSSHQIHEVERVADVVAILRGGELVLVERLERLKQEVSELTVTLSNGAPQPPEFAGEMLRQQRRHRQWQLLARHVSEAQLRALRDDHTVASVEVRTPNLEEIFVALMSPHVARETAGEESLA